MIADERQALERALARNDQDYLAHLYLGLVFAKAGDRERSVGELKNGLQGLDAWLSHTIRYAFHGDLWGPSGEVRSEIDAALAMVSGSDIDGSKLIASAEWVGKKTEEEIDLVQRDEDRCMASTDIDDGGVGARRERSTSTSSIG